MELLSYPLPTCAMLMKDASDLLSSMSPLLFLASCLKGLRSVEVHSTLPYPALPNPVTSLYRSPFWRRCHGKHGAHVHRNSYARSRARGRMYMRNVHVCMFAHVCASPCILSYGHIRVTGTLRDGRARIREG